MALRAGGSSLFQPLAGIAAAALLIFAVAFAPAHAQNGAPVPLLRPTTAANAAAPAQPVKKAAPTSADEAFGADDGSGDDVDATDADSGALDDGAGVDGDAGTDISGPAAPPPPDPGPPRDIRPGSFTLEARLTADGDSLKDGVEWRIFGDRPGSDGRLPLLGQASGGVIYIRLDPGIYYIHAALGRAGLARRIEVKEATGGAVFVLNAGGVRLLAMNGKDVPLQPGDVSFDVYAPDEGGSEERSLIIPNAPPGKIIGLPAGTYHVVSRYGDANAVVRADIRVDAGKLTEATVYQKAARLTLKLVEAHGGEALANTEWSVLTPAGDSILESVGAFPTVVLAAGEYKAVARHDGKTFQTTFKVEPAVNRDVEVLLR
jgi:hypothetical protein